jgi:hypothetical protein
MATKGYIFYDSVYMKCSEIANVQEQKDQWLCVSGCKSRLSARSPGNSGVVKQKLYNWIMVMAAQFQKHN